MKPKSLKYDVSLSFDRPKKRESSCIPEWSRKPAESRIERRAYAFQPSPKRPDCHPALALRDDQEPAESIPSTDGFSERSIEAKLTDPPNDADPNVEVPTPRCTWIDWSEEAKLPKSVK